MILSASDPAARVLYVRLLQSRVIAPLASWLGALKAAVRAAPGGPDLSLSLAGGGGPAIVDKAG